MDTAPALRIPSPRLTAVSMLCLLPACLAQSPPQPAPSFKVHTPPVTLLVTVRDRHGALAGHFAAAGLTLTQDGRAQKIESFTQDSALPFRLGLLIDTSRGMSRAMGAERTAAEKFVDAMLPSNPAAGNDQAFLIHFDREVELLRDFTSSRQKLHSELDQLGPTSNASQEDPQAQETSSGGREWNRNPRSPQLYDAIFLASGELMMNKDGRKALIVFSGGVDHGSKESLNDAIDAADRANVEIYTIHFKGGPESGASGFPGHGGMGGAWPGSGWPGGYPGDVHPASGSRAAGVDGKKILETIARRTGGRAFEARKAENLDAIYTQIAQELRGQYVLTFTPGQVDNNSGYHKLALETDRHGYEAVTREGYYTSTKNP